MILPNNFFVASEAFGVIAMGGLEEASLPLRLLAVVKMLTLEPAIFIQVNLNYPNNLEIEIYKFSFPRHSPGACRVS